MPRAQPLEPGQFARVIRAIAVLLAIIIAYEICRLLVRDLPIPHLRLWLVLAAGLALLYPSPPSGEADIRAAARGLAALEYLVFTTICVVATALMVTWIAGMVPPWPFMLLIAACMLATLPLCRWSFAVAGGSRPPRRRFLVHGRNELGQALVEHLRRAAPHAEILGFIDENAGTSNDWSGVEQLNLPAYGTLEAARAAHSATRIDGVIIARLDHDIDRIGQLRDAVLAHGISVFLAPPLPVLAGRFPIAHDAVALHCFLLGVREFPLGVRATKRIIDVLVASTALILFAPVMAVSALLIRLDDHGPVFFRQRRFARGNRLFDCYKFRSMRSAPATDRIELTTRGDSRVTRIGHFLRRTSLDEIPQFLNVLQGHMSVVGPRPHPPGVMAGGRRYEEILGDFAERYKVKPGITGFAQVSGLRGNTFTEEDLRARFRYDIAYIRHWSLPLELWIILKTLANGFWGRNAF